VSSLTVYVLAASAAFGLGVYGLIVAGHVLRKLMALNMMGSAVFVLMVAVAGTVGGEPDPVAQALVLTGIVIAVGATAFALALLVRIHHETGRTTIAGRGDDGD
jgi:multicomponent Na+:H+ antiporter subunit C